MIRNVVFDIGNVLVRWSPQEIIKLTFGANADIPRLSRDIFLGETWRQLNCGEINEAQAALKFQAELGFSAAQTDAVFYYVKHTQCPLYGSVELVKRLKLAGYQVFALTDNLHEIVAFLKQQYDFWSLFEGAVVSAEEGCMKPSEAIFSILLERYDLDPSQSVFLDDVASNVAGAKRVGMQGVVFENAAQAYEALQGLGVKA